MLADSRLGLKFQDGVTLGANAQLAKGEGTCRFSDPPHPGDTALGLLAIERDVNGPPAALGCGRPLALVQEEPFDRREQDRPYSWPGSSNSHYGPDRDAG